MRTFCLVIVHENPLFNNDHPIDDVTCVPGIADYLILPGQAVLANSPLQASEVDRFSPMMTSVFRSCTTLEPFVSSARPYPLSSRC